MRYARIVLVALAGLVAPSAQSKPPVCTWADLPALEASHVDAYNRWMGDWDNMKLDQALNEAFVAHYRCRQFLNVPWRSG